MVPCRALLWCCRAHACSVPCIAVVLQGACTFLTMHCCGAAGRMHVPYHALLWCCRAHVRSLPCIAVVLQGACTFLARHCFVAAEGAGAFHARHCCGAAEGACTFNYRQSPVERFRGEIWTPLARHPAGNACRPWRYSTKCRAKLRLPPTLYQHTYPHTHTFNFAWKQLANDYETYNCFM